MEKELCFIINNEKLYLEHNFVEYMDIPIFFLCKSEKSYYVVQCIDMEELTYIIDDVSMQEVYDLLHGKIPMRDIFLKQRFYWQVFSVEKVENDTVEYHVINELDKNVLPEEKAVFKILTDNTKKYVDQFKKKEDTMTQEEFEKLTSRKTLEEYNN